jgi:hypothetical protein
MKRTLSRWSRPAAALVLFVLAAGSSLRALTPQSELPGFGLVGMAPASQFLRLNVTNPRLSQFLFLGPHGVNQVGPCDVELSFGDGQGNTLKRAEAHLAPGLSTSLDLTAADLPGSLVPASTVPGGRVEILPGVLRGAGCTLVTSVEVIDTATGQTAAYLLRKNTNGNGFIPNYGLVGMVPGMQFLRFNISNEAIPGISTNTCQVALSFTGPYGQALKQTQVALSVGTSTYLDLTVADLPPTVPGGQRLEVLPSVSQAGRCAVDSSVEVITTATGRTSAYAADAAFVNTNR